MIKAVIVGCGNIAVRYATDILAAGTVDLVGFHDVDPARAADFADKFGGVAFDDLDEAIDVADLVINLTIFESHYPVSLAALNRSRHVYSEKPLALHLSQAIELAELAERNGVRLGAAPFTFLGAAQATVIDWVRSGRVGTVRLVYAEVNHGRIETWHPNPAPFYEVGPMLDVGVYPLAILLQLFGPVRRLQAVPSMIHSERVTLDGTPYTPGSPDYWLIHLEHADGVKVRLTVNFYAKGDEGMTFHGDEGSLHLGSWFSPDSEVMLTPYEGEAVPVTVSGGVAEVDWSWGVAAFVAGIGSDDPGPINAEQAVQMAAVLDAIERSGSTGGPVDLD